MKRIIEPKIQYLDNKVKKICLNEKIEYNKFDKLNDIDRKSCLGEYQAINGLPMNPRGCRGVQGKGSLLFLGPNHALEVIITRFKYNNDLKMSKLEFIMITSESDCQNWYFPWVI